MSVQEDRGRVQGKKKRPDGVRAFSTLIQIGVGRLGFHLSLSRVIDA
jgi:hypothetical protein